MLGAEGGGSFFSECQRLMTQAVKSIVKLHSLTRQIFVKGPLGARHLASLWDTMVNRQTSFFLHGDSSLVIKGDINEIIRSVKV